MEEKRRGVRGDVYTASMYLVLSAGASRPRVDDRCAKYDTINYEWQRRAKRTTTATDSIKGLRETP